MFSWRVTQDRRTILYESVEYEALLPELRKLPKNRNEGAWLNRSHDENRAFARAKTKSRTVPKRALARIEEKKPGMLAQVDRTRAAGVVLDYETVSGGTNIVLKGGATYYLTGGNYMYGTTVLEDYVIKCKDYHDAPRMTIKGPFVCGARTGRRLGKFRGKPGTVDLGR